MTVAAILRRPGPLRQAGWPVTVLERAPEFGEAGAGLGVTGNGLAALQALGLAEAVRTAGHLAPHAGFQDPAGRWLLRIRTFLRLLPAGPAFEAGARITRWTPPAREA